MAISQKIPEYGELWPDFSPFPPLSVAVLILLVVPLCAASHREHYRQEKVLKIEKYSMAVLLPLPQSTEHLGVIS